MIRELAKRLQFMSFTTVDGNRLDAFMQGIVERFNQLKPRDIERRWTQTMFVTGYAPALLASGQSSLPWLNACNLDSDCTDPDTPGYPTNKWRIKGTETPGIEPDQINGQQRAWAWAGEFSRPVRVNRLTIYLRTDGVNFVNSFNTGGTPPPGSLPNESLQDFGIELSVDNPFSPENRSQGSSAIQKVRFWLDQSKFSPVTLPAVTDMEPKYTVNVLNVPSLGRIIDIECDEPIPQNSRVRVNFVMPEYVPAVSDATWGEDPWFKHIYSLTVGVLEPTL
jgi:hypothetical protein